jgi:uncharacterized membrane protein
MVILGIVLLWAAFAATHMGLSSLRLRPRLVSALGAQGFQGVYSLLALGTFVPLVWLYFAHQHAGPHLWYLGHLTPVRWIAYLGMALALTLVAGGLITPSPASLTGGDAGEPRGVLRITRHPLLMGLGLFGAIHLLAANVNAAELVFFAGFPVFVVLGCRHQDQRKLAGDEAYGRFVAQTGFLPFTSPGASRGLREGLPALALGVGLAVLLRSFHPGWFGGAP